MKFLARTILFVFSAALWLLGGMTMVSMAEMPTNTSSDATKQAVMCALSAADEALPVQVEKVRTSVAYSAKVVMQLLMQE